MIITTIKDQQLRFETSDRVFSPENVDQGTLTMLSKVDFMENDKVLDLGCGYGVVGILAAKLIGSANVVMVDISKDAIELSKQNLELNGLDGVSIYQSDGFNDFNETNFSLILSNPPYHVDFNVPKHFIEKGFNRLRIGGKMYMVTKRKDWYKNKMISIFGGVKIWEENDYFVFMSIKNSASYSKKAKK